MAGTAAALAYLNAKYHLAHDLGANTLNPTAADVNWIAHRVAIGKLTTYDVFEEQALKNRPNQIFLVFEGREYTYREFFDHVNAVGKWLSDELGIQPEEVVALNAPNGPEFLMMWLALDGIGAVPSFINYNLTGKSLVHCVKVSPNHYNHTVGVYNDSVSDPHTDFT